MSIKFRNYINQPGITEDYHRVRKFFIKLGYAESNLNEGNKFNIIISDQDLDFQDIAAVNGYIAAEEKESDAIFYLDRTSTSYSLPAGFSITSMNDNYDLYQYLKVLWKELKELENWEQKRF